MSTFHNFQQNTSLIDHTISSNSLFIYRRRVSLTLTSNISSSTSISPTMCEKLTKFSCGHYTRRKVQCEKIPANPSFFRKYLCRDKKPCNSTLKHFDRRYHSCPGCQQVERDSNEERQRNEARAWWATIDLSDNPAEQTNASQGYPRPASQEQMRLRGGGSSMSCHPSLGSRSRRARRSGSEEQPRPPPSEAGRPRRRVATRQHGNPVARDPRRREIGGDSFGPSAGMPQTPSGPAGQAVQSRTGESSDPRSASASNIAQPQSGRSFSARVQDPNAYTVVVSPGGTCHRQVTAPNGRVLCPPPRPSAPVTPTPRSAPGAVSEAYIVEVSPGGTTYRRSAAAVGRALRPPPRSAGLDTPSRGFSERMMARQSAAPAPLNLASSAGDPR